MLSEKKTMQIFFSGPLATRRTNSSLCMADERYRIREMKRESSRKHTCRVARRTTSHFLRAPEPPREGKPAVTHGLDAEKFIWDGLALVHRDGSDYLNEPAIGGGNPIASNGKVMLNDMLGSTVAVKGDDSYSMTSMTAFGESSDSNAFFTGKPFIGEIGYAFQ